MTQTIRSIRIFVAALACLWPVVFFAGLPAAASVLSADTQAAVTAPAQRVQRVQRVLQRHEPSFFLDVELAAAAGSAGAASANAVSEPQRASAGSFASLGTTALFAVLLLAAFNARKRRSRPALTQN